MIMRSVAYPPDVAERVASTIARAVVHGVVHVGDRPLDGSMAHVMMLACNELRVAANAIQRAIAKQDPSLLPPGLSFPPTLPGIDDAYDQAL